MFESEETEAETGEPADTRGTIRLESAWMDLLRKVAARRHRTLAAQVRAMVEQEALGMGLAVPPEERNAKD